MSSFYSYIFADRAREQNNSPDLENVVENSFPSCVTHQFVQFSLVVGGGGEFIRIGNSCFCRLLAISNVNTRSSVSENIGGQKFLNKFRKRHVYFA